MDARGIDMSVVTASTVLQGTSWADPQTDLELCRRCNDTRPPTGWRGTRSASSAAIVLPLQDVTARARELERGV